MATEIIKTKVIGVTHDNPNGINRQAIIKNSARVGNQIILVPEPDNPVDPQTVAVWIRKRILFKKYPMQLGYLKSRLAHDIYDDIMDKRVSARILEVTGGTRTKPNRGVNIEIYIVEQ